MEDNKKCASINDYILLQTLGEGLNSVVKLGQHKGDGKMYAVKIINEKSSQDANIKAIINEGKILMKLDHPNILKVRELREDGVYTNPDGSTKKVLYEVLELANGGEVFDFLSLTGRFNEQVSRYYFRQLIEALDHCHSNGYAHRDVKPENLLFDENFNLVLADFGFSAASAGKDGSGKLKTVLGTDNYMAPEIHSRFPYIGSSVDLFAAGIILFIFFTGHPPFNHAKATDSYYGLICMNNHEKFWNFHARRKPGGLAFFPTDFINLINAMLAFDPTQRPSIAEIKAHPWYKGEVPTAEQIRKDFSERKAKVDEELRKKKEQTKRASPANAAFTGVQAKFRDVILKREGVDDVVLENNIKLSGQIEELKLTRSPPKYIEYGMKSLTNYYSGLTPEVVLKTAAYLANSDKSTVELYPDDFKISVKVPGNDETISIDMRVYTSDLCTVLEFMRVDGSIFEYKDFVSKFKQQFEDLEGEKPTEA